MSELQPSDPNFFPEVNRLDIKQILVDGAKAAYHGLAQYFPPESGYPSDYPKHPERLNNLCPDEVEAPVAGWNAQGHFVDEHGEEW
jgi:hypothetical protein